VSVTVRTATPDSAQLPLRIGGRAAGPDEWDQWSEEPGHDLVALIDGRVVGGVHVSLVSRSEAWLENLRVLPDAQGRGIAAQLVKEAEAVARRYGAAMARTAIPAHEYAAQAVAERGGYKPSLRCVVVEAPLPSGPAHIPYDAPDDFVASATSGALAFAMADLSALPAAAVVVEEHYSGLIAHPSCCGFWNRRRRWQPGAAWCRWDGGSAGSSRTWCGGC